MEISRSLGATRVTLDSLIHTPWAMYKVDVLKNLRYTHLHIRLGEKMTPMLANRYQGQSTLTELLGKYNA